MNCDLHTHSIYSDGTFSPAEIIFKAKELGLGAVALTDHNTVSGLNDFLTAAKQQGVTAVGGVELSTAYGDIEFHLLGLFIDPKHYDKVERLAKEFHVLKEISNIETIERLNEAGYDISYSNVRKKNPNGNVNRAHIAAELLKKGYVKSVAQAFSTILADGAGFYVPPTRLQLIDAIKFLKDIDALAVLAHPLKDIDEVQLRKIIPVAIEAGLVGIETHHSSYDDKTIKVSEKIADDFNIFKSGGSDFHGQNKPDINLGIGKGKLCVPIEFYNKLYNFNKGIREDTLK